MHEFCVITKVPDVTNMGNLASLIGCVIQTEEPSKDNDFRGVYRHLHEVDPELALLLMLKGRIPVFSLGEIIILDESGREVGGHMRKPSKWDIEYETFTTLAEAVDRSVQALAVET